MSLGGRDDLDAVQAIFTTNRGSGEMQEGKDGNPHHLRQSPECEGL
jgi:hypothetical protein